MVPRQSISAPGALSKRTIIGIVFDEVEVAHVCLQQHGGQRVHPIPAAVVEGIGAHPADLKSFGRSHYIDQGLRERGVTHYQVSIQSIPFK